MLTLKANDCVALPTAAVSGQTFLTDGVGVKVLFFPRGKLVVTANEKNGFIRRRTTKEKLKRKGQTLFEKKLVPL